MTAARDPLKERQRGQPGPSSCGSTLEKANALLKKFGIEKFFGVKNGAAFEKAVTEALNLGLTSEDAMILATAKAQGTALATKDKAVIAAAKKLGVAIK